MPAETLDFPIKTPKSITITFKPLCFPTVKRVPSTYDTIPKCRFISFPPNDGELAIVHTMGFLAPYLGWKTIKIQMAFPDALYQVIETGEYVRVEFENFLSNFLSHGHNPTECDVIVCWENDIPNRELQSELLSKNPSLRFLFLKHIFHNYDFD